MILTLSEIARITGSGAGVPDQPISAWSIDTRTLPAGALYIALHGETHDGHSFLGAAAERGAAAAIVDRQDWPSYPGMPLIPVEDPLTAMQSLAREARRRMRIPVIGITGSAGKTTTKDVVSALLGARYRVSSTVGNLNNHIGLPLSILRTDETAEVVVLEMGMNHAGEIRALAAIAAPTMGVVTNVGTAHIENFEGIEGIAAAKRELIESLPASGVAVLNADDPLVRRFGESHPGRTILYGLADGAEVRAHGVEYRPEGSRFRIQETLFEIALPGRHGVLNVAAGVAAGMALGVPIDAMAAAARELRPAKMRGERLEHKGVTILNDCYNSNPEAAETMLELLAGLSGGRKIAILGEMLELGRFSESLHRAVGESAARHGIHTVIGIRGAAEHLVAAAQSAGIAGKALFFADPSAAGEALRNLVRPGDTLLFKGSRGTRVEQALERFLAD